MTICKTVNYTGVTVVEDYHFMTLANVTKEIIDPESTMNLGFLKDTHIGHVAKLAM